MAHPLRLIGRCIIAVAILAIAAYLWAATARQARLSDLLVVVPATTAQAQAQHVSAHVPFIVHDTSGATLACVGDTSGTAILPWLNPDPTTTPVGYVAPWSYTPYGSQGYNYGNPYSP
jgi:hypothetical protein